MKRKWYVKRVPVDFDWPLGEVWHGYVNPWPGPVVCPDCFATGFNPGTKRLNDTFRSWAPNMTKEEERELLEKGPTRREIKKLKQRGTGSDTPLIRLLLVEIRAKRRGAWGPCGRCGGNQYVANENPAVVKLYTGVDLYSEWHPLEPPFGEGWQLWEDPSPEGRPVSKVFVRPEDLATWCAKSFKTPASEWLEWILKAVEAQTDRPPFRLQSENFKVFEAPKPKKTH